MKTISVALAAHFAGEITTLATCLRFVLKNKDDEVRTFTDHDADLVIDGETYIAVQGYNASDLKSSSDLNPDTLDIIGILNTSAITEDELFAGFWDGAEFRIFYVNWSDLTQGSMIERQGSLGEVTVDRGKFTVELRGRMQNYAVQLGRVESPSCNANLGDARCKVDLDATDSNGSLFRKTGVTDGASPDGLTLYASDRTEAGPTDTRDVTGVTNADPGVVSYASPFDPPLIEGEAVVLSGIVGPNLINTTTIVRNPGDTSFELGIDTSDTSAYPGYVSGGKVTRLGDSGFFDFGLVTMIGSGNPNAGISREVKSYVPGQFVLQQAFPYEVTAGDEYIATAGCDKSLATCRDRFNNVVNNRSFPYLLGTDKIVQVGRHGNG
jgi:hypothetical protein